MAKKVIVLDRIPGAFLAFRYVLWADVPASRQSFYVQPDTVENPFKSAYDGATTAEKTAIKNGQVAETLRSISYESSRTRAQVEADLETEWNAYQAEVTGKNQWAFYGSSWDGTTWTRTGAS